MYLSQENDVENAEYADKAESFVATLDLASIGQALTVQQVKAPPAAPEWERWLEEIGFIAGEHVMLMARGLPGGDPLVVRIGQSTFALRRAEAACVRVAALYPAVLEGSRA
ncbi:MAG: ferrous iron transport protein A [Propionivibrio sp.]|nr:ferrous iron transport protein A [Propionivibrio sp.]